MPGPLENNLPKASHWRFDAVDLRAGLAFAAWRADIDADPLPAEVQAVYFAPPSFTPQPVANVALALGSTRGSLRPGLFVDGREMWFGSLAEAGEFLRRAYVASGGGDGGDGEGDDDPSPPLPEPPDLPDRPQGEGEFNDAIDGHQLNAVPAVDVLVTLAIDLQHTIPSIEPGTSHFTSWQDVETADGLPALLAGATHALHELLMRRPGSDGEDTYLRWLNAFRSWWMLVGNLGLRSILVNARGGALRPLLLAWAEQHEPWLLQGPEDRHVPSLVVALLVGGDGRMRDLVQEAPWLLDHWEHWPPYREYLHPGVMMPQLHGVDTAPCLSMTTLRTLPLPRWAWNLVGNDLEGRASLYHLLCTLVAQPQLSTNPRHFELMLFACACVVGGRQTTLNEWPHWGFEAAFGPSKIQIGAARQVAQEALQWLKEHLPISVFSEGYEQAITAAKDVRYRA